MTATIDHITLAKTQKSTQQHHHRYDSPTHADRPGLKNKTVIIKTNTAIQKS